jgi:hypothetical protein
MSVIAEVYNGLKTRIADRCPSINHFGLWNSQETEPGNEGAYSFPALFVHFQSYEENEDISNTAKGTIRIALHVQFCETYQDDLPDFVFPIIDEIHSAVYGWSIPCAGPFRRRSTIQDENHSNFQDWVIEYEGPAIDDSVGRGDYDQETPILSIRLAAELTNELDGISDPPSNIVIIIE